MGTVGVGITPFQTDDDATIRLAARAEELGYARFGAAEGWTHDAVVLLARIAGVTSRIGLATAVLPVWSRTPAAIAMAAASLQRASDGRFALGLGASSPPLVEGLHGLAPSSVRLAGELADHWLPFLWARSRLPDGRALLAEGEAAGEESGPTGVSPSVPLALGEDEQAARQIAAGWLLAYLTRMGPLYPRMLGEYFGFAREVDVLLEANGGDGPPRLPAAAERLAQEVTVMATYDDAPQATQRWLDTGADTVDLVLPLGVPEGQLSEMLEAAAPR